MNIEQAFAEYGPAAIFLGAAFEGNMAVIAGGFLAHQKLLPLWVAFASATAGSWLIDQALFLGGRRFRNNRFVQKTCASPAFAKALGFIERYPTLYILVFRFLYGLRLVSPIALGVTRVSDLKFFLLNILGAVIWAGAFTLGGYFFGTTIEAVFGRFKVAEHYLLAALGIGVAVFFLYHLTRRLRARRA